MASPVYWDDIPLADERGNTFRAGSEEGKAVTDNAIKKMKAEYKSKSSLFRVIEDYRVSRGGEESLAPARANTNRARVSTPAHG